HPGDVAAGPGGDVGRKRAKGGDDLLVDPGPALGDHERLQRVVAGRLDDPVVDVGVVADVQDLIPGSGQVAAEHVEHDHVAQVADVGLVVDGDPAQVDADPALVAWDEGLLALGQRVVQLQGHGGAGPGRGGGGVVSS